MSFYKQKLVYVLPKFKKDDATHFSHIHDFLKELIKKFDIYLLVERGEMPDNNLGCRHARVLKFKWFPFRILETLFMASFLRLRGYHDAYVHYSFLAATIFSLVMRPTGGRVFYWNCGEPWKYKRSAIRDFFENKTYKVITHLVTGAESIARQYANHYRIPISKIKILPNWIDLDRFNVTEDKDNLKRGFGLPLDKKIILFVHHLSPRKGAHHILPVVRELLKKRQDILFVVIGSGPYDKIIRADLANDPSISSAVRLEGEVPNRKIPTYFSVADVFFMPSEEEGFPRVLLESMAMGVPFVASSAGGIKDFTPIITHKYIVNGENIPEFVRVLNEIINQPLNRIKHFSNELKEWVKRYDVHFMVKNFSDLFM